MKVRNLKAGNIFKHRNSVYIMDDFRTVVNLVCGKVTKIKGGTIVRLCANIRAKDIKERK